MDCVLGTANLGLSYGTAIRRSLPDEAHVAALLDTACACGVGALDTAAAYGESEARIGRYAQARNGDFPFRVSTKTNPALGAGGTDARGATRRAVTASAQALDGARIDQLLIHRWTQHSAAEGAVWSTLRDLRSEGAIGRLGASVQDPAETRAALDSPGIETIQLACNILDWRYDDVAPRLAASPVRVEVRSVLLQGLLGLSDQARFPVTPEPYSEEEIRGFLGRAAAELTGGDPVALCLRYAASLDWADALVLGADGPEQLEETLALLAEGPLPLDATAWLRETRPRVPASLLDPARWL